MPKVRPDQARRAQRARRRDPMHRPRVEVHEANAQTVIPALAKLGMDASAPAVDTGDKVWALASVSTLLVEDEAAHRPALLEHRVLERVLYTLKSDTNLEVRREASGALRNLCQGSADDVLARMVELEGLDTVLQVMRWASLGLQNHEQRLERARAPLLAEQEKLLNKPVEQMNRKERRLAAKLAQGRAPSAAATAVAEFTGDDALDTLDVHGWGHDAPASLMAMDSAAAQCLVDMCENLVTVLAHLVEASDVYMAHVVAWDWHAPSASPLVGEALVAWLCQAVHLGVLVARRDAALQALTPDCARALARWATVSAHALAALTDAEELGVARGVAGIRSLRPSAAAARAAPADVQAAEARGTARLGALADAAALLALNADRASASTLTLAAAAGAVLVHVYQALQAGAEMENEERDPPCGADMTLSELVQGRLLAHLAPWLARVQKEALTEEERTAVEVSLELAADVATLLGDGTGSGIEALLLDDMRDGDAWQSWPPAEWLVSPMVDVLVQLAMPSAASESAEGAALRATETRALAVLHNGLWRLASFAPPPPSQWPEDDEALARIDAWRAWAGTAYLSGAPAHEASAAGARLLELWERVFAIAAHWASVDSVANASAGTEAHDGLAHDGLAMVSTCLGSLWSIARILEGQLPLTQGDAAAPPLVALMAAYDTAHAPAVRVQAIGTLAALARSQHYQRESDAAAPPASYHRVYLQLAQFWLQVAGHVPDAETLAAVLNAIVDTYANELAPWDSVYGEAHMQSKLVALLPSLAALAKKVDRRRDAPLYAAAMEGVQNLRAFLAYRESLA